MINSVDLNLVDIAAARSEIDSIASVLEANSDETQAWLEQFPASGAKVGGKGGGGNGGGGNGGGVTLP